MKKILLGGSPCTFWSVAQRSKNIEKGWLDLPCIVPFMHMICDACLLNGIKADDDLLPRICKEINAVSRKLEETK